MDLKLSNPMGLLGPLPLFWGNGVGWSYTNVIYKRFTGFGTNPFKISALRDTRKNFSGDFKKFVDEIDQLNPSFVPEIGHLIEVRFILRDENIEKVARPQSFLKTEGVHSDGSAVFAPVESRSVKTVMNKETVECVLTFGIYSFTGATIVWSDVHDFFFNNVFENFYRGFLPNSVMLVQTKYRLLDSRFNEISSSPDFRSRPGSYPGQNVKPSLRSWTMSLSTVSVEGVDRGQFSLYWPKFAMPTEVEAMSDTSNLFLKTLDFARNFKSNITLYSASGKENLTLRLVILTSSKNLERNIYPVTDIGVYGFRASKLYTSSLRNGEGEPPSSPPLARTPRNPKFSEPAGGSPSEGDEAGEVPLFSRTMSGDPDQINRFLQFLQVQLRKVDEKYKEGL